MGWFCRCRRREEEPFDTPPVRQSSFTDGAVSEGTDGRRALMSPKRHPRRTRIFVRMPSGDILPADMDLEWTTMQASEYIVANCRNVGLKDLEGHEAFNLRFRRRILSSDLTLKESGAEIGSILGLVPSESQVPPE
ncbi:unnamed protein product [Effrenium voratum]|uniref:UBX domain-containing protein n=1 Tax=Effrenium voratum TaxID=2562239 RepID=A0AA36JBT5_9DINO|nr:unnamed protein product [Effrenium voratum]CAJ1402204.1 unnamed protein product [Effrenium voratum]CAJ1433572.1 unnamed protein product [Effrenium voratum]|mmetsp:Transcript_118812/g.281935  ORF Transcript_118812/g.281935 Transcript_118812/m.281935 type:complete len:136 (-) Transcript_118812:32-439(-)